jgi:UDP-N-acetylglucosamine--N-acetylmuramyl-(pentapeptide) pyrophosphoryl-undecaprenol N-acetylglucosamine transferase
MKVVLAGGGTGGHFYPLIAIAQKIHKEAEKNSLAEIQLYYFSDAPYDTTLLLKNNIIFKKITAGKLRLYFSLQNITDVIKTGMGVIQSLGLLFSIFPDVVIGKGGYASFPTIFTARILGIPVIIHESDSSPGRVNAWASTFAKKIAVSYPEATSFFPKEKTACTGQPIREEVLQTIEEGSREYLKLTEDVPTILIMGGSQGAEMINTVIMDTLPELLEKYQVIHQTGPQHIKIIEEVARFALEKSPMKHRYRAFGTLNELSLRMSAGIADLIISRAGSSLFEIASWEKPSIIVPITESHGDHQRKNAFNYARHGGCVVIEESNLKPHLLLSEIGRILENETIQTEMKAGAKEFFQPNAAEKIAQAVISIGLQHEKKK